MVARKAQLALRTVAARMAIDTGRGAQQTGGERVGERALAEPRGADEEQRVRQPIAEADQARPAFGQPREHHRNQRSVTMRQTSARISSGARSAATTTIRSGACRARSR
ncbi:hypothetical protein AZKH_2884 [Azoarcus sp. KH32C]|nr:hypothetical protein AZKH_2884 [Azoarcus sp. KH32C]